MTRNELIWKIEHGDDIMFDVQDRHFTIITWPDEGIIIDEQFPNDGHSKTFETARELVDGFLVDNIPLAGLADRIRITDYTQVAE